MKTLLNIFGVLAIIGWMFHPYTALAANTYATFNPADCDAAFTLSNGNLTVVHTAANAWKGCRATIGKSSGKWYWEYKRNSGGAGDNQIGMGQITASLTNYLGVDATAISWAYLSVDGSKTSSNSNLAYGTAQAVNDVIGVAMDMDLGSTTIYKNCVGMGAVMYSNLSGTVYPIVSEFELNNSYTANFGATALTCTPPTGFNSGMYTASASTFNFGWLFPL